MSWAAAAGRALVRFALSSIGSGIFAPGAAALLLWVLTASVDPRTSVWAGPVREFLLIEGIVFAGAGGCVVLLMRWPLNDEAPVQAGTWRTLLVLGLVAVALLAAAAAWPLVAFLSETIGLLQAFGVWQALKTEFGGLVLAPVGCVLLAPMLEAAAALSFMIAPVLLVSAMRGGNGLFTRALGSCILIQAALVQGGYATAALMHTLSGPAADAVRTIQRDGAGTADAEAKTLLAWIERHDAVTRPVAEELIWVLAPSVALAGFAYYSRRSGEAGACEPAGDIAVLQPQPPLEEPAPAPKNLEECFRHPNYLLKGSVISAPAYYPDAKVVFEVRKELFVGRTVLVSAADGRALIAVARRGLFSPTFQVTVPATNEIVGTVSQWTYTGRGGAPAGSIEETQLGLGFAKYAVRSRGLDCCTLTFSCPFQQSEIEIEFAAEANQRFDPRMGLALAVILNDRARARSMEEPSSD